jgi:predicted small metal-binding protein
MMKLACKDIDPSSTCDFVAEGNTASEVAEKMLSHAKTNHPDSIEGMADIDAMRMMEAKVHA